MELFISEAEIEDASMIIDYLNQVGGVITWKRFEKEIEDFKDVRAIVIES